MNTKPLADYIQAAIAAGNGDQALAEIKLASAVGVTMCTPYMSQNIRQLANTEAPSEVILTIILGEMKNDR